MDKTINLNTGNSQFINQKQIYEKFLQETNRPMKTPVFEVLDEFESWARVNYSIDIRICPDCTQFIDEEDIFCPWCGNKLPKN